MYTLVYQPDQAGYSVTPGAESVSQKLKGGLSRYRMDVLNASSIVTCTWTVDREKYEYLRLFYRVNMRNGSEAFNIDLILDHATLETYVAKFVPETWKLAGQQGHQYIVTCNLEIEAKPQEDPIYDETIIMLVSNYGSEEAALRVLNKLNKLVNYDIPGVPYNG